MRHRREVSVFNVTITANSSSFIFLANGRYDLGIKQALSAAGGTGFVYPTCSAPAYASGNAYTQGSQVSYDG